MGLDLELVRLVNKEPVSVDCIRIASVDEFFLILGVVGISISNVKSYTNSDIPAELIHVRDKAMEFMASYLEEHRKSGLEKFDHYCVVVGEFADTIERESPTVDVRSLRVSPRDFDEDTRAFFASLFLPEALVNPSDAGAYTALHSIVDFELSAVQESASGNDDPADDDEGLVQHISHAREVLDRIYGVCVRSAEEKLFIIPC